AAAQGRHPRRGRRRPPPRDGVAGPRRAGRAGRRRRCLPRPLRGLRRGARRGPRQALRRVRGADRRPRGGSRRHLPAPPPPRSGDPGRGGSRQGDPLREAALHLVRGRRRDRCGAGGKRRPVRDGPQPALPAEPDRGPPPPLDGCPRPRLARPLGRGEPAARPLDRRVAARSGRRREPLGLAHQPGQDGRRRAVRHRLARRLPPAGACRRPARRRLGHPRPLPPPRDGGRGHRLGDGPVRGRRHRRGADELGVRAAGGPPVRDRRRTRQPGRLPDGDALPAPRLAGAPSVEQRPGPHLHRRDRPVPRRRPERSGQPGSLHPGGTDAPGHHRRLPRGRAGADSGDPRGPTGGAGL
ncbi:MAG: Oxidoreductase, partial [uncultured Thermomicrobiales bacterium]